MIHFNNLLVRFDLSVVLIAAKSAFQDNSSFDTTDGKSHYVALQRE